MDKFADAAPARLRTLIADELARGERELQQKRSGYEEPVVVAFASNAVAALPAPLSVRADASALSERAWLVVAAAVEALVQAGTSEPLEAGALDGRLLLRAGDFDPELAVLAFDEAVAGVDRLRARGVMVGELKGEDWREPIGAHHPLRVAHAVARLGGRPSDPASVEEHEDAVLQLLGDGGAADVPRPHDDPDTPRRVARRILQRLDGMGKWGGYHTEFAHLARGFAPSERALASEIGEALLQAGLLAEKPSVGQRHVFLDPRRVKDIRGLIERGEVPAGLELPRK
ncbi:MAG TPA: hypothetical protein VHF89_08120 [Solirubrobacteraceae bacterium]|nr:hypothetical protein [Solirubrobacteraceae bacterium]